MNAADVKVKIFLVNLKSTISDTIAEPLGIETLAAVINERIDNVECQLYNHALGSTKELVEKINSTKFDIICLSMPNGGPRILYDAIEKLTQQDLSSKIIIGGRGILFHSDEIIKRFNDVFVVKGEGEESIVRFINYFRGEGAISEIPNLIYCAKGLVCHNKTILPDLDFIPKPLRTLTKQAQENNGYAYLELGRGCSWGKCTFCVRSSNNILRDFKFSRIKEDILNLNELGIQECYITDEDFFSRDLSWLIEFCDLLKKNRVSFSVTCQTTSINNLATEESLRILKKLKSRGLRKIFIGVDSGVSTQLRRYNKNSTIEINEKAVDILRQVGFDIRAGFIMFDPLVSIFELRENIDFIRKNNLLPLIFSPFHAVAVRKKSPYETLLKNNDLLLSIDEDSLTYDYKFKDERIGMIYNLIKNEFNMWVKIKMKIHRKAQMFKEKKSIVISDKIKELELETLSHLLSLYDVKIELFEIHAKTELEKYSFRMSTLIEKVKEECVYV